MVDGVGLVFWCAATLHLHSIMTITTTMRMVMMAMLMALCRDAFPNTFVHACFFFYFYKLPSYKSLRGKQVKVSKSIDPSQRFTHQPANLSYGWIWSSFQLSLYFYKLQDTMASCQYNYHFTKNWEIFPPTNGHANFLKSV